MKGSERTWLSGRTLPEVVFVGDEPVIGPFCKGCGYPLGQHTGPRQICPPGINPLIGGTDRIRAAS
jgi:hypothetical protein